MLIRWNVAGPLAIADPTSKNSSGTITVYPGVNELPDDVWKKLKDHAVIKSYQEEKNDKGQYKLEVVTEKNAAEAKDSETGQSAAPALADLNAKKASELIKETLAISQLEQWLEHEQRSTVRNAIEKQLKYLREPDTANKE